MLAPAQTITERVFMRSRRRDERGSIREFFETMGAPSRSDLQSRTCPQKPLWSPNVFVFRVFARQMLGHGPGFPMAPDPDRNIGAHTSRRTCATGLGGAKGPPWGEGLSERWPRRGYARSARNEKPDRDRASRIPRSGCWRLPPATSRWAEPDSRPTTPSRS